MNRYKSNLYIYLIICGVIYVVYSTFKGNLEAQYLSGWFKGIYFFLSLIVMVIAYMNIAKKSDAYIKENHPDLYDRFYNVLITGTKQPKRPVYIGLQSMFNTDYLGDPNLKTIRKEAKLYAAALAIVFILTLINVTA